MSLTFRLATAFAAVSLVVFAVFGAAAVKSAGDTVERGLEDRIDSTLSVVRHRKAFFIFEASRRTREFRQLADISGFEIIVRDPATGGVAGSSLPRAEAEHFLADAPAASRFETTLAGTAYRGGRAVVAGRTIYLLARQAAIRSAKAEATRTVLLAAVAGLIASVLLGAVLAWTVTRPLRRLAEQVSAVKEEDLAGEMPQSGGREVTSLARAFREMLDRLGRYRAELVAREKMATLGRFSAAAAHELRNPLSAIRMTLQMLRGSAPESMQEDLDLLLSEIARLDHSVEALLFHAGAPHYEMGEVDPAEIVTETVRVLAPLATHLNVGIETEVEGDRLRVRGDRVKLRQAVMNLVLNAIQASGPDQTVTVASRIASGRGEIEVVDEGPGPPEGLADRLFDPFVTGREGGTGLGLAITRSIAKAHGGDVFMERRDGRTVFRITFGRG